MDRRQFILLTGAAGGAMVLGPAVERFQPAGALAPEVMPGVETVTATTCLMCPGACGLKVRQVDGFPVGIGGNPNHPLNEGGVCSEGIAALQLLTHPDRLLHPLKRSGRNRANAFEPVSWDAALEEITAAMRGLRKKGKPQKLAFVCGRTGGTMEDLVEHFMASWGSPHLFLDETQDGYAQVFEVMHGLRARPAFDFDNAGLVLSFGADLLEAWQAPLQFLRSYSTFHSSSRSFPAKLIAVDIRLSRTAARADEWVGITPGSYGALALGIAYVMVREKLYDGEFLDQHLYGFEDSIDSGGRQRLGYRSLVLRDYSPEVVSRITGVAVERILALGKAFGENPASVALFDENVTAQPGGLYAAMAVHSLNLLKGNLNRPGGIYLQPTVPLTPLSPNSEAGIEVPRRSIVEDLAGMDARGDSPEVLFLYYSNPLYSSPARQEIAALLEKVPLVISFSPFADETSRLVDFVLPDALFLERWEDRMFPPSSPASGWAVVQPCVQAAGQTRHSGDVLLDLARRLGPPLKEACPWETFEELLKHRAYGLHSAWSGTLCTDRFQQGLVAEMERRGWWMSGTATVEEFWQGLLDAGAWSDPNYQARPIDDYSGHPDGRIDLYSRTLQKRFLHSAIPPSDRECLPHYHAEDVAPDAMTYPMTLNPYRQGKRDGGTHAVLPWILQGAGALQNTPWNSWAEINPSDARRLGLRNLDWIWIESPAGRIRVRAIVYPGAGPGVVNVPSGLGHTEMGRWARGRGVNPLMILAARRDPVSGLPDRFGTKVKVYKAG